MITPVDHHAMPSGAPSDAGDPSARRAGGSTSADTARAARPARPAQPARQALPAEQRGRTDILDRVVTRIAVHLAGEVARVREVGERGPLTFGGGSRATVDGEVTTLRLNLTVEYPAPLLQVAEEVRRHVTERLHVLTGLNVGPIDINVTNLVPSRGEDG